MGFSEITMLYLFHGTFRLCLATKPPPKPARLFTKKSMPAAPSSGASKVQLRDSEIGASASDPTANYRQVSVLTDQQALAEMMKLCNRAAIEDVYKFGRKLGSGAGGTVYQGVHNKTADKVI